MRGNALFRFDNSSPVFLYGDNPNASCVAASLIISGFKVLGVIDKKFDRASKGWRFGAEVLLCSLSFLPMHASPDSIIIICLSDGLRHDCIANQLYELGFDRIVFTPMNICFDPGYKTEMRRFYSGLFMGSFSGIELPCFVPPRQDWRLVSKKGDYSVLWCPTTLLFTPSVENANFPTPLQREIYAPFANKPIAEYAPYFSLFMFLAGLTPDKPLDYLRLMRGDRVEAYDDLLRDRGDLYRLFTHCVKYEVSFFEDSPARVGFDEETGKLFIVDGFHRALFLMTEGYESVPVCILSRHSKLILNHE